MLLAFFWQGRPTVLLLVVVGLLCVAGLCAAEARRSL